MDCFVPRLAGGTKQKQPTSDLEGAVACCSRFLLTCALPMTPSDSKANNPVKFDGKSGAFPGQIWKNGQHWNMIMQGDRYQSNVSCCTHRERARAHE